MATAAVAFCLFLVVAARDGADGICSASGCSASDILSNETVLIQQSHSQLKKSDDVGSPAVEINNKWLVVNNKRYSRKKAHEAWLGRIGRTSGIWIRPVLINFRSVAPPEWFDDNVKTSTTLTLSSSQVQKITAGVDGGFGMFSGDASITSNSSHNASYVLRGVTFSDTIKIKRWFNNDTNAEFVNDYMDMYSVSQKPRIVTTVWILVRSDPEHGSSCTGGHLTLRYNGTQGHVGATISGNGCVHSTWSFDPDTIVAYEASYLKLENMVSIPPRGRVKDVPVDWYWTR